MERMSARARSRPPKQWTDLELTMPQAKTLFFLGQGPKRMSELADYLGRGMSSATSMIDRLVSKGLVERAGDATDRRAVACKLTPVGVDAVERFWRIGRQRIESIAGVLTVDELRLVVPAMQVLVEAMERLPDPQSDVQDVTAQAPGRDTSAERVAARYGASEVRSSR